MPPQAQGTKLVKVEGQMVRVPVDATPDEIDQIAGGAPPPAPSPQAYQRGAMQRQPGGPIFTPKDIQRGVNDRLLREGRYEEFAQQKEDDPERKAYEASSMRWASPGIRPDVAMRAIGGTVAGAVPGAALGRFIGGNKYGNIGAGLGGLVGGLYGGYRGANEQPLITPAMRNMLKLSRWGKALGTLLEEPGTSSGAAREMAGGTAASAPAAGAATDVALGSQAGPAAPKNASELSSTVQRIRSGTGPGTAASPIYTPESLASEQGMSTAALGKGGFNLTIPPEQQRIMQLVQEGKVPMGGARPQGFESLGKPTPFAGASPQPPSGTSPSFGEPEGDLDAAIRGAAGQNPVIKSTDKAMAGETPNLFNMMSKLAKYKRSLRQ